MAFDKVTHSVKRAVRQVLAESKDLEFQCLDPRTLPDEKILASNSTRLYRSFSPGRYGQRDFYNDLFLSRVLHQDERFCRISELVTRTEYFQSQARSRIYMLRKLVQHLYGFSNQPDVLMELGSAGSLAPALAFPASKSYSIDISAGMFANEFNYIPAAIWNSFGLPVQTGYRNLLKSKQDKARAYSFISSLLPNHERLLSDMNRTPLADRSVDLGIIFGQPNLWNLRSCREAERVIRPGGYMLCLSDSNNSGSPREWKSFYQTGQYQGWWAQFKWKLFEPEQHGLGFIRLETQSKFRKWEEAVCWRAYDRTVCSTGYVVEIFKRQ